MEYVRVSLVLVYALVCLSAASRIRRRWVVDDIGCRTPDKGTGICKRISECKPMLDFLASKPKFSQKETTALASYQCGVYGKEPKVCCPQKPITLEWIWGEETSTENKCVSISNCKIIYDFIVQNNDFSDQVKEALRKYSCGVGSNGATKVMCPDTLPPEFQIDGAIVDDSTHPNFNLLPKSCGISGTSEKITNGNETNLFEFPWAAVLKYDKKVNPYSCGGSLISDRYVLTAAHCIKSQSKLISVRLGEHNFNKNPDCDNIGEEQICAEAPQDFEIDASDAIVHPDYNPRTIQNDIAIIRLRSPANTTVYSVAPVCIPTSVAEKTKAFENYTVIGWGATETGFSSPILLKVIVPKVDLPKCVQKYESQTEVTDKQICAGGKNEQDSCAGDSGGPLSADFTDGVFRTIQYGIVSFGPRICAIDDFPAVYTRVDKYTSWILDNMRP